MKSYLQHVLMAAALVAVPIAHAQESKAMNPSTSEAAEAELAQHLIDLHFDIWNDPEPSNWDAKFPEVYAPDFFVADPAVVAHGYARVGELIRKVHAEHAGFIFTPAPIAWNHGLGRVTWGYGPRDNPNLVRGEDIFTIKDGKLASAYVFLDKQ